MEREGTDCLNLVCAITPLSSPLQCHSHLNASPAVICPILLSFLPSNSAPDTTASTFSPFLSWLIVVWLSQSPSPGPGRQAWPIPLSKSTMDHSAARPLQRNGDRCLPSVVVACVGIVPSRLLAPRRCHVTQKRRSRHPHPPRQSRCPCCQPRDSRLLIRPRLGGPQVLPLSTHHCGRGSKPGRALGCHRPSVLETAHLASSLV